MTEQLKQEIKERMKLMGVNSQFINQAIKGDVVIFERQNRMFTDVYYSLEQNKTQEPYTSLAIKIEELKIKYNHHTYMVQLTHTDFGDLYSLFGVNTKYVDEWKYEKADLKDNLAFVYVWNASDEDCSEFGTIAWEKGNMGGIIRTA